MIRNVGAESEIELLKAYAPNVETKLLEKLSYVFQDLRELESEGQLTYPYSTRELVSVAKHLQAFPSSSLEEALHNVFSFDFYNKQVHSTILSVLKKHGIHVSDTFWSSSHSHQQSGQLKLTLDYINQYNNPKPSTMPKHGKVDPTGAPHVGGNMWAGLSNFIWLVYNFL